MLSPKEDFFSSYLDYRKETESPVIYHRWSAISAIAALLGKQYWFQNGHFIINPNLYIMLMGVSGARKSAAIIPMREMLIQFGYTNISADKTTKERYLEDLGKTGKKNTTSDEAIEALLNSNGDEDKLHDIVESYIVADEFNDFFYNNNVLDFVTCLGKLWDHKGPYDPRLKNSKSLLIPQPVINLLGGNTPTNFAKIFPPEILGQGFFSRILLIHGEPTGKKITFLPDPDVEHTKYLLNFFHEIKSRISGRVVATDGAMKLIDKIYKSPIDFFDVRFESYPTRRFNHLIKLCLILSAARLSRGIEEVDVIHANTVLTYAEHFMPKALGEFGKAKNSDVSHKILHFIESSFTGVTTHEIWKQVSNDLERLENMGDLLKNLQMAEKIQLIKAPDGRSVFLPKRKIAEFNNTDVLDFGYLTDEERFKIS